MYMQKSCANSLGKDLRKNIKGRRNAEQFLESGAGGDAPTSINVARK